MQSDWYYQAFSRFVGGPLGRWLVVHRNFFAGILLKSLFFDKRRFSPAIHRHYLMPLSVPAERKGCWVFPAKITGSSAWLRSLWERRQRLQTKRVLIAWGMRDIAFRKKELNRLIPILLLTVRYLIWFAAFLLILAVFEIDITVFLAGAGIAGIALTLAAQDIISNFLGGAIIAIDKPFRIGDRVRIDTFFGDVVSIGGRSTRIRTRDNRIVTIPNATITKGVVINYAQPDTSLKIRVPFSVAYGSDLGQVTAVPLEIAYEAAEKTPWVMTDPSPSVSFLEFGESGIIGQLFLWITNYDDEADVKDWVIRRVAGRFAEEKIDMPFRQVDVWMRKTKGS